MTFIVTLALDDCIFIVGDCRLALIKESTQIIDQYCESGTKVIRSSKLGICFAAEDNAWLNSEQASEPFIMTSHFLELYIGNLEQRYSANFSACNVEGIFNDLYFGDFLKTPAVANYAKCFVENVNLYVCGYQQNGQSYIGKRDAKNKKSPVKVLVGKLQYLCTDDDFFNKTLGFKLAQSAITSQNAIKEIEWLISQYIEEKSKTWPAARYTIGVPPFDICQIKFRGSQQVPEANIWIGRTKRLFSTLADLFNPTSGIKWYSPSERGIRINYYRY